ncbi:outer membrane beta-barrel protein [Helicobacter baculiformis]|uniref:Outer membrane beta-barrel protein n=1 Tax=Helicobacter baculiformis TaxID=427351 RepID=A0ABV7ZHE0_9HELI|nr:outer membrane beta-barrel protein [Helicobacter baculiformis]
MAKSLILNFCLCLGTPLIAHPFASYLDGGILSVGIDVGGGNAAKELDGSNLRSHSIQLGFQLQGGYQKYFTPFIGASCYGYLSYRYLYMDKFATSLSNINNVNRYSLGLGGNLLVNVYSKIEKSPYRSLKIYAYGFFGGLLGLVNIWTTQFSNLGSLQVSNNANIDATFGIHIRVDTFKWSLGIHVPLIDQTRVLMSPNNPGSERLKFISNYKSSDIFMNFTKIF